MMISVVADALKFRLNRGLSPDMYFIRDYHGLEADLVIENGRDALDLYEIKSSMSFYPAFADNLRRLAEIIPEARKATVVYSGKPATVHDVDFVNFASSPFS